MHIYIINMHTLGSALSIRPCFAVSELLFLRVRLAGERLWEAYDIVYILARVPGECSGVCIL